jgi:hypothetical protein
VRSCVHSINETGELRGKLPEYERHPSRNGRARTTGRRRLLTKRVPYPVRTLGTGGASQIGEHFGSVLSDTGYKWPRLGSPTFRPNRSRHRNTRPGQLRPLESPCSVLKLSRRYPALSRHLQGKTTPQIPMAQIDADPERLERQERPEDKKKKPTQVPG